ncbi:MAG: DsrE family protein [Candidatus Hydrogenedentes bacterium]|nr:DsrE family protein [Candidatus Hydrogenedentota bacterium]
MKNRYLFPVLLAVTAAALGAALGGNVARSANHGDGQHVVVHLSKFTSDLHASFMAFKLADAMQAEGARVTVLLDLEGVRLVDRGNPLNLTWGTNHGTLEDVYTKFVGGGGRVIVCPHCADVAGVNRDALRDGAMIGVPDEQTIPRLLLEADKILDY